MNTQKALELLQIPNDCSPFEGQVRSKTSRSIAVIENYDFTSGKLVRSTSFEVRETNQDFGAYMFNLISNYIHHFNHEYVGLNEFGEIELFKPFQTTSTGWINWQKVIINGSSFDVINPIWMNVNRDGSAASVDNPTVNGGYAYRIQRSITRSSDGTIKTYNSKKQYVPYTKQQLMDITGMSDIELAEACRTSFNYVSVNPETHVTSISMDIQRENNQYTGTFHINGMPANTLTLSSLTTSYGKPCPSFVFRWLLINSQPSGPTIYGQSALASFTASDNNTVTVQQGSVDSYDPTSKTFTFNPQLEQSASLIAMAEFLPATGKQENAGAIYGLESNLKYVW